MGSRDAVIENVTQAETHLALARRARQEYEYETVKQQLLDEQLTLGWEVERKNKSTIRLRRPKPLPRLFEDRVWTLMYSMGFPMLSGKNGALLRDDSGKSSTTSQIDVVAFDDEVALYVECRSAMQPKKAVRFAEDAAKLSLEREAFTVAVDRISKSSAKRRIAPVFWAYNLALTDADRERAEQHQVRFFNEDDLKYYENLVKRIGSAARFQFLADVFRESSIPGLILTVPAIRMKLGTKSNCYTFSISPDKLLKIAYISHRWRRVDVGDPPGYQRFMSKSRLDQIRRFIQEEGGYFPTNIVVNLQGPKVRFEKSGSKEQPPGQGAGDIGWLHLPSSYRSAWVIDGQHRLFAYAGIKEAKTAHLTVVAFDNLGPAEQLNLFVEINSKQKKVAQNLLTALYGDLRWDSQNVEEQASAIVSRLVLRLGTIPDSPLFGRISNGDDEKDDLRCITLGGLAKAINQGELFVRSGKGMPIPGAFWTSDRDKTLKRAADVIAQWFDEVTDLNREVWDKGKGPGGGLAMNNGCTVIINVLKAAVQHLVTTGVQPHFIAERELIARLQPFSVELGRYFAKMTESELLEFRSLQGIAGQTAGTREALIALTKTIDGFSPPGIKEIIDARSQRTSEQALLIIEGLENLVRRTLVDELKAEFGNSEEGWWFTGVPNKIRMRIDKERNEEATRGVARAREDKLTFADIRDTARANWGLFGEVLGAGPKGARRDLQLAWLGRLYQIKIIAADPAKDPVRVDDLEFVRREDERLHDRLSQA